MISAAFCSNSGGETINSEQLWSIPTTYLKAVVDTFSNGMRNSSWEKKMPAREWLNYLKTTYKYPVEDTAMRHKALNFEQITRKMYFPDSIPLKSIRKDLELKSTFFSIKKEGENVILKGKGYGHGVGLSQEGAIKMVRYKYKASQILKFYYKDVEIINYEEIKKIE
jgi:stage II sporulation protein D